MNYYLRNSLFLLGVCLASCASPEQVKYEQYVISGGELYQTHCSNCHGKEGDGLRNLYPPIRQIDFLKDVSLVACSIKNGLSGPMEINGKMYNQKMPANKNLYNLDIAQVITFMNAKWGKTQKLVDTDEVAKVVCE